MDATPACERGIMVALPCPHGRLPSVIRVPAESGESAADVYLRMALALTAEGESVPIHYRAYGFDAA